MTADAKKLARLHRLERIRAIAKQAAASESAEAENTLEQLLNLARRTDELAAHYAARSAVTDGAALRHIAGFIGGLQGISASTTSDATRARSFADGKLALLAAAERKRGAVEARAQTQQRVIVKSGGTAILTGRKPIGTGLE